MNEAGEIPAQVLTDRNVDDARTGIELIDAVGGELESLVADAAYDTHGIYDAVQARSGAVAVPPVRTASASRSGRSARDRTVRRVKEVGRRRWMKESGYHRQGRVENTFFRYKQLLGGKLRARCPEAQEAETQAACRVLNSMASLGIPKSVAVGA